jgi:hypothetical protein
MFSFSPLHAISMDVVAYSFLSLFDKHKNWKAA